MPKTAPVASESGGRAAGRRQRRACTRTACACAVAVGVEHGHGLLLLGMGACATCRGPFARVTSGLPTERATVSTGQCTRQPTRMRCVRHDTARPRDSNWPVSPPCVSEACGCVSLALLTFLQPRMRNHTCAKTAGASSRRPGERRDAGVTRHTAGAPLARVRTWGVARGLYTHDEVLLRSWCEQCQLGPLSPHPEHPPTAPRAVFGRPTCPHLPFAARLRQLRRPWCTAAWRVTRKVEDVVHVPRPRATSRV